ncbi:hypothetical protein D9M73_295840 [compost metagenome]
MLAELLDRRHDAVEFDGTAGFHILQHGALERAQLCRNDVSVFRALFNHAADARSDQRRFFHGCRAEPAH